MAKVVFCTHKMNISKKYPDQAADNNPKYNSLIYFGMFLLILGVFLKNAWISEDAYILFRSVEQFHAGFGPVWNQYERVQTFTSPLWYWLLVLIHYASQNLFVNTMLLSLVCLCFTLLLLQRALSDPYLFVILGFFLLASNAFFDFTSSGLENGLAYLVIAWLVSAYHLLTTRQSPSYSQITSFLLGVGTLVCVRHDLILLCLPASCYVIWRFWRKLSIGQWLVVGTASIFPLLAWSVFSLLYYGLLFPNTFYAKLFTGIEKTALWSRSLYYFRSSFIHDPITIIVLLAGIGVAVWNWKKNFARLVLAVGIGLHLLYIVSIGGDFMQGRFFSYGYLLAVCLILLSFPTLLQKFPRWKPALASGLVIYALFFPHTPLNSPTSYKNLAVIDGIADERGVYYPFTSIFQYYARKNGDFFLPDHPLSLDGYHFHQSDQQVYVHGNIGLFGYFAGLEKIIIDPNGLSDPFLAQLPIEGEWRVGHYFRKLPAGYLENIQNAGGSLENANLDTFYRAIILVSRDKNFFSQARLQAIWKLNTGGYRYLIEDGSP
jgi:arabinofuranosyltransferase